LADFRWNAWNLDHATQHGVTTAEAEHVVRFARRPYPRPHKDGTWIVVGPGDSNRTVQVIFVYDDKARESVYIIHAMPLARGRRNRRKR
jgi:hypothetical protein